MNESKEYFFSLPSHDISFAQYFVRCVYDDLDDIKHKFVDIAFRLKEANEFEYYKEFGFETIHELAEAYFGFKRSSTYNLINIARNFMDRMKLKPEYEGFSQSQLVEMVNIPSYVRSLAKPSDSVAKLREEKQLSKKIQVSCFTTDTLDGYIELCRSIISERSNNNVPSLPGNSSDILSAESRRLDSFDIPLIAPLFDPDSYRFEDKDNTDYGQDISLLSELDPPRPDNTPYDVPVTMHFNDEGGIASCFYMLCYSVGGEIHATFYDDYNKLREAWKRYNHPSISKPRVYFIQQMVYASLKGGKS